jgi:hypothetical protein
MEIYGKNKYKGQKLVSSFLPRKKYVCHYRNLRTYLENGMILKKIHRVLTFKQTFFLKSFVDYCTEKRSKSKTDFGKRLYKDLVNSNFGKFVENVRNRLKCYFCHSADRAKKLISHNNYYGLTIINQNFIIVYHKQYQVKMDKAYPVGFSILELSKEFMFRQYYTFIKPALQNNCTVYFSDTDSLGLLVYGIKNPIKKLTKIMDFSNYPTEHPLHCRKNESKLGFFKDEVRGNSINSFVGMRSKTYALDITKSNGSKTMKTTCKGIRKSYKKELQFSTFLKCLEGFNSHEVTQHALRSFDYNMHSIKMKRRAFSSFDDKRYLTCPIHSLPYGSKYIKYIKNNECPLC